MQNYIQGTYVFEDVPLVEFMYLVFTRMPGKSYGRRLRSLLCLCDVSRALITSLACWFCLSALGLVLFQIAITSIAVFLKPEQKPLHTAKLLWCTYRKLVIGLHSTGQTSNTFSISKNTPQATWLQTENQLTLTGNLFFLNILFCIILIRYNFYC